MKFLLDTDHISILQRPGSPERATLFTRMSLHPLADFVFSIVSFHEQVLGTPGFINRARTTPNLVRGY